MGNEFLEEGDLGATPRPRPRPRPHPALDPAPSIFGFAEAEFQKAFVVLWDERIPLTAEGRVRLERQLRKAVLAELAEMELDNDIAITAVSEPDTRGLRIQRM